MSFQFYVCFLIFLFVSYCCGTKTNSSITSYEDFYHSGVTAYLDERWQECIDDLETSIHVYKLSLTAVADCRIKCQNELFEPLVKRDIEDLHFYDKIVKRTLCFIKCKRIRYPNVVFDFPIDKTFFKLMEDLTPYSYLHICYFQKNLIQKAVSAAFTYLVKHPNDKTMKSNMDYYLSLSDVDARDITNFEVAEYLPLYLHGMNAYNNEDWESVIAYMEESLLAYFAAEQRCRVLCEGSFDQGWLPDFTSSVANHFTYCLKCKQHCVDLLKTLNGMKGKEILADQYNYLQMAYSKMDRQGEACKCVASYLLIYPTDEEMIHNKKVYSSFADPTEFVPRPEIVHYLLREEYETKLLQFIDQSFTSEFNFEKSKPILKFVDDTENEISNDS